MPSQEKTISRLYSLLADQKKNQTFHFDRDFPRNYIIMWSLEIPVSIHKIVKIIPLTLIG